MTSAQSRISFTGSPRTCSPISLRSMEFLRSTVFVTPYPQNGLTWKEQKMCVYFAGKDGRFVDYALGRLVILPHKYFPLNLKEAPNPYSGLPTAFGWKDVRTTARQHKWETPIRKLFPALAAWTVENMSAVTAVISDMNLDSEATLKVAHGDSRNGTGGETAAWARFSKDGD